jgi:hypothetical protein
MGPTESSQRRVVEDVVSVLEQYKDSLCKEKREILDEFIEDIYQHVGSVSYATHITHE